MKRFFHLYIFFGWLIFSVSCAKAQDTLILANWGKSTVAINNRGGLGFSGTPAIEFPISSGKFAIKKVSFWATGIVGNDTFAVVDDVFSNRTSWAQGPMSLALTNRKHVLKNEWPGLLKISNYDIDFHKNNYKSTGYLLANNIGKWPGSFSIVGFPKEIAAFADIDGNALYEPLKGDYPWINGRELVYSMQSDSQELGNLKLSQTNLDMSTQWFVFDNVDSVSNAIFFRLTLCNRGNVNYSDVRLSAINDLFIGNPSDNYLSTRVPLQSMMGYNSSDSDDVYGRNCPVVSWGWLNTNIGSSIYIEKSNDIVRGIPQKDNEYYFMSRGYWKTGKYVSFGSSGIDDTVPSKFVFGYQDPAFPSKTWDEASFGNPAGQRTGVVSTVGFNLNAGSCVVRDGYISIVENINNLNQADSAVKVVRSFYNKADFTLNTSKKLQVSNANCWPNPVKQFDNINLSEFRYPITLLDANGRYILKIPSNQSQMKIDLKPGIYILKSANFTSKLLVIE